MSGALLPRDIATWCAARPYLDVRSNDEHTLISYRLARALLRLRPEVDEATVLTAILFHDVGWKAIPADKLVDSVGPKPKYPELQRVHEIEGVAIARPHLQALAVPGVDVETVLAIIDGHDTRKQAISPEDEIVKEADKLWRFTSHGVKTICGWFGTPPKETVAMLEDFVLPQMLTKDGRAMAEALVAQGQAMAWLDDMMHVEAMR
ncbi:HD domain-containing protein [Rhizobium alvei]|uniref:HD domain-containing protein n=1 Tax=Rhizobium alvei TaxID=1132659 RepID=A0ABT8YS10_9HYPH|nr:HD domain-containing protein [Rhizobium alvei]MDO6966431.1 HD domain-containing protein [Rhizobium alvei]